MPIISLFLSIDIYLYICIYIRRRAQISLERGVLPSITSIYLHSLCRRIFSVNACTSTDVDRQVDSDRWSSFDIFFSLSLFFPLQKHHHSSAVPYTCGSYLLRGLNKGKSTLFASLSFSSSSSPPQDSGSHPGSSPLLTSSVTIDVFPRLEAWVFLDHPFLPLPLATHPPTRLQQSLFLQESSSAGAPSSSSQQTGGVEEKRRAGSSLLKKKRRHRRKAEKPARQPNLPIYVEKRMHPSKSYDNESTSIYYGTPVASLFSLPSGVPNDLSSSLITTQQKAIHRIDEDDDEDEEVLSLALGSSLTFFTRGGPPTRPAVYVQQTRAEVEKRKTGHGAKEEDDETKRSRSVVAILPEGDSSEYTTIVCLKPGPIPARLLLRTSSIPRKGIDV